MFLNDFKCSLILKVLFSCSVGSRAFGYKCLKENDEATCVNNPVCNNSYYGIHFELFPYSGFDLRPLLQKCCGTCLKLKYNNLTKLWLGLDDVDDSLMEQTDFIYPVLGRNKFERHNNEFFFLPIVAHAGFTYVTLIKMSSFEMAIRSCLGMYPLFIICFMMSILFGFIFWIFGTLRSKENYPRHFPIGWLKGMWWSMATMISTGPESTPNSFIGRVLALIWLIVAVIMVSLISSIITAALVKPFPTPSMSGAKVGTLRFNTYNELEILRHNGEMKTIPGDDMEDELFNLLAALRRKELDGVLIDKYTLRTFFYRHMLKKIKKKTDIKYIDFPYVLTDIKSDGSMAYGVLVANDKNFEYFKSLFAQQMLETEKELLRETRNASFIEKRIREKINAETGPLVFTIHEPYIETGMIWLTIMIGIALFIGSIYEIVRRKNYGVQKDSLSIQGRQAETI